MSLTKEQLTVWAKKLNVEPLALDTIYQVESSGGGYLKSGRPKILFEGHIFWKELVLRKIDPNKYLPSNRDILYKSWTKKFYKGGEAEYDRLARAIEIHGDAALMSASWGSFQILGRNYGYCGCKDVNEFVHIMSNGEEGQLQLFAKFLEHNNIDDYLRSKNWKEVARLYNGNAYAVNKYDKKLEAEYKDGWD